MTRHPHAPTFGAVAGAGGVRFRVCVPDARFVQLHLRRAGETGATIFQLPASGFRPEAESGQREPGIREIAIEDARPGDRYAYSMDGGDPLPDPASRFQPDGVHGWSEIIDPSRFAWTDDAWNGLDPRRAVIYELHVGTFTRDGTFAAAAEKIPYLVNLGITAIELMPVADFAGAR
jgi:maltooligosyltrehalose trehalohydrolase